MTNRIDPQASSLLRRGALAATAAVVTVLLVGCGGGPPADEPAAAPEETSTARTDLCPLLTAEEIQSALGSAPGEAQPGTDELGQCSWPTADGSGSLVLLTLEEAQLDSFDDFVAAFGEEFGGENPPRDEYHPVEGVPGDWAMYVAEDHMVRAFRGQHVLEVSAPGAEEAAVVDLAAKAMAKLP